MGSVKQSPDQLPGKFDERVFIGGNYNIPGNLRAIKGYVKQAGFVPIFPLDDYDIPKDQIHDWDVRLLHNCRYAIFDVSVPAGELMEIERALTFKTKTLLVFQVKESGQKTPEQVASMLRTSGHRLQGYSDPSDSNDLGEKVKRFLLEEEDMEAYEKAFGYIVDELLDHYDIRADGSATRKCEIKNLSGAVWQIYHATTTSRGKVTDFSLEPDTKKPMHCVIDQERSNPSHKEGHVILEGGLSKEDGAISYSLSCDLSPQSVCLTKKEIDKEYSGSSLPYETAERHITFPIRKLILQVRFFDGYKAVAKPAVFRGEEMLPDPVRLKRDSFTFDEKSNSATFCISCPRIFHNYIIYWEPID